MNEKDLKLKAQIFICTSCTFKLPDQTDCSPDIANSFRKSVKELCRQQYSKNEVRITGVNCLSECENGIAAVVHPSGKWLLDLRPGDEEELLKLI